MTNTEAKMLAKQWVLGNRNRKASLTRKYNLRKASSPNTGRLKMGIRIDIENNPRDYKPAIDDDGGLVFFTGKPIKRILAKQLFTPPKARKEEVMKEATIDRRLAVCKLILKNKDSKLVEQFSKTYEFDINEVHSVELRKRFTTFVKSLSERTQYQLVAQKVDGAELKSKFYDKEEDLVSMQQKCEELDEYESTMIVKRVVDTDEDKEIKEDDVDPKELFRLTDMALRQVPNSAAQKDIIDQLNIVREKLGMKKLVEKEVMVDSLIESAIGLTHYVAPGLDARKKSFKEKLRKLGYIKQVTKDEAMSIINIKNELETLNQRLKDAAKNKQRKEVTRLKREIKSLEKKKRKAINAGKEVGEDAVSRAKEKADLKKKHDAEIEREKEEIEDIKAEQLDEKKIAGLVKKADKSGIPYGILKQVYNRGMAAWKTGHRPGTTPQQWAFARVNSFITGGKTRTTADKDLWSKASAAKKKKKSVEEYKVPSNYAAMMAKKRKKAGTSEFGSKKKKTKKS